LEIITVAIKRTNIEKLNVIPRRRESSIFNGFTGFRLFPRIKSGVLPEWHI